MEYDRPDVVTAREGTDELCISEAEVLQAIGGLKNNKAVPVDSLTAEIWKLCHRECASYLHRVQQGVHDGHKYPREVSDSALALLPGPGKPSKQPGDSRPLGLQDPCSKVYATVLKHKITEQAQELLASRPHYAYSAGEVQGSFICVMRTQYDALRTTCIGLDKGGALQVGAGGCQSPSGNFVLFHFF